MRLVDRIGRRKMLYFGLTGAALSLAAIAATASFVGPIGSTVSIIALMAYIGSFAISLGPVPHIMMSEVFPLALRGRGMGLASVANWGCNFLVVFLFPAVLATIGIAGVMSLFAVVCVLGLYFTLRYVPETRGVALEEIERRLDEGRLLERNPATG